MDAAVSCVGVAPQSALLTRSFADSAAVARALSFSLSDNAPAEPHAAATTTPAMAFTHNAAGPGAHPSSSISRLGPAGGGAGKRRRPRPSKRAPTTYISTDAATFRLMVQRVTGAEEDNEAGPRWDAGGDHLDLGLLLPHLGVVGLEPSLLPPPDPAAAYASLAPAAPAPAEQPLFPTLDSWNVMYGKNEVA